MYFILITLFALQPVRLAQVQQVQRIQSVPRAQTDEEHSCEPRESATIECRCDTLRPQARKRHADQAQRVQDKGY